MNLFKTFAVVLLMALSGAAAYAGAYGEFSILNMFLFAGGVMSWTFLLFEVLPKYSSLSGHIDNGGD